LLITAWNYATWLGATKDGHDWTWNNGDSLDMNRFSVGQPNDSGSCLAMLTNFYWNDNTCDSHYIRYVCEKYLE